MKDTIESFVQELIEQGALFFCNHSGGKDSQAMYAKLKAIIPSDQLIVVHAHLPEVEWDGVREHIQSTISSPYYETQASKTFLGMVENRGMWPSSKYRQCTSDLKRDPLSKLIRTIAKERGCNIIVNCMGMRAQESPNRAKKPVWKYSEANSKAGRTWYEWLPIHDYTTSHVFQAIKEAGQEPHWVYEAGMTRLSCCFCIMASDQDLTTATKLRPKLAARYDALAKKINHTLRAPKNGKPFFLADLMV
jgi:DNA sulfur modification protein DndC